MLLHGALFGVMSSPALVTASRLFGLDVIAPERPGYGMTALPDGVDPVDLAVARARDTLRAADVVRALVVAHDVGTAYAYAFALARAAPDCVSAIICAPATPPVTDWAQTADMPPLHHVSAFVTQKAPAMMEAIVKLGVNRVTREGLRALPQMIFADSAHDRGVLQQLAAYPVLENLFLSVTDQQGAGFLNDLFVTNLNWSGWLRDIVCPMRFQHGAKSQTVSRAAAERTCTALPDARLMVVPDAGHTLPLTHPELAFREALLMAAQSTGRIPLDDTRSG
ncbi:MAG: alpha/beta hydrolase [Paracoccus sp. (in: a-proteobacteria)]|nr:alpha/beta hydrolase [Paracoccus sp. (in: a-proteobacteria)]